MRLKTLSLTLFVGLCLGLFSFSTAVAQKMVPFKLAGSATWDSLANALDPNVGMRFEDGAGQASHLGKFTAAAVLFAEPPINFVVQVDGTVTLVAANGDELYASFQGPLDLLSGEGNAMFVFNGGTGRFRNATGCGELNAYLAIDLSNPVDIPMDVFWSGVIDY